MRKFPRRSFLQLAAAAAAAPFLPSSASALDYPARPVRWINGFAPGGSPDVIARLLGQWLSARLHQNFVIENRPGAGTTMGTDYVAKSAPDGYTLLMASSTQTVNETLYKNRPYQLLRDLVPIAPLEENGLVLVVSPSLPVKTLAELLALARSKPGTLNYGSSGPGSNYHMAAELLKNLTGIDIVHVPYKGSTGMRIDILSGQIQMLFDSIPTMAPYINAGKVRALGTSGTVRSPILPDVPTIAEAGVPGFEFSQWVGFMAPKSTPQPIVDLLHDSITAILSRPDIKEAWDKQGATPMLMTQPEFASFMAAQVTKWAKVINDNRITLIN
jgi:tripartite-type tricarboxylate transporter receptor subunit TctC